MFRISEDPAALPMKRASPFPGDQWNQTNFIPGSVAIPSAPKRQRFDAYPDQLGSMEIRSYEHKPDAPNMNVPVMANPDQNLVLAYGQMLFIVRMDDDHTSIAGGSKPMCNQVSAMSVYNSPMLIAQWKKAAAERANQIANGLMVMVDAGLEDFAATGGQFMPNRKKTEARIPSSEDYVTCMAEFDEKIIPLGPFIAADIAGAKDVQRGANFVPNPMSNNLMNYKHQGKLDGMPNIFGVTQRCGSSVAYLVRKMQNLTRFPPHIIKQGGVRPVTIFPWRSDYTTRPFVASDATEYQTLLANFADKTMKTVPRTAKNNPFHGPAIPDLTLDQLVILGYADTEGPVNFLKQPFSLRGPGRGHESISGEGADSNYADLAYLDYDICTDERRGYPKKTPRAYVRSMYEVGRVVGQAFVSALEAGSGWNISPSESLLAMEDKDNKTFNALSHISTIRMSVGM